MAEAGAAGEAPPASDEAAVEMLSVSIKVGASSVLWADATPDKDVARVAVELAVLQGEAATAVSEEATASEEGAFHFGLHLQSQQYPLAARERVRQQLLGAPAVLTVSKGAAPIARAELHLEELVVEAGRTRVECELPLQAVPAPEGGAAAKEWVEVAEGATVAVQVELSHALTTAEEAEGADDEE